MNSKYRIWDYDNKAFDYIDLLNIEKTIETFDSIRDYFHADYLIDNPDFIQNFVGLQDIKQQDIYNGDFLKCGDDIMLVVFRKDKASFALRKKGWMYDHYFDEGVNASDCEIIGNIHENPELLDPR